MMTMRALILTTSLAFVAVTLGFCPGIKTVGRSTVIGAAISNRQDFLTSSLAARKSSWSVDDDWSSLSSEHPENAIPDTSELLNADLAASAAQRMEAGCQASETMSDADAWVKDAVDTIQNNGLLSTSLADDPPLYDTGFETRAHSISFEDELGNEISMLVNCNVANDMLAREGRVLAPLTDEELNDPSQLVHLESDGTYEATTFFRDAISSIFHSHARYDESKGHSLVDAVGLASWMTKCLWLEEEKIVSSHDKRVLSTLGKYATHGSGYLTEEEFHDLYLSAMVSSLEGGKVASRRDPQLPTVESVFRDIRSHGISTPVEVERDRVGEELRNKHGSASMEEVLAKNAHLESLLDECEILEWKNSMHVEEHKRKSSHELVELASDNKTPLRMRDGDFVFIDEESCIGCAQCVSVAPSSFVMLESGRARTFHQRHAPDVPLAVSVCPVNCMHSVAFHELKEMENARDHGDGRTDHRHMGQRKGHTPLSVAGIDSDSNHKSSWYHYLKGKCNGSSDCPKRGCYDCPSYAPGENPYFKELHRKAEHVRAVDLTANGEADEFRKTVDL